jgi:hypothetical protein
MARLGWLGGMAAVGVVAVAAGVALHVSDLPGTADPEPTSAPTSAASVPSPDEAAPATVAVQEPLQPGADADQLLDADQISRLDPDVGWRVVSTTTEPPRSDLAYTACRDQPAADLDSTAAHVRTFAARGGRQWAVEEIEVSASLAAAADAHRRAVRWYAGCQAPRVQLADSLALRAQGTSVTVLELRRWSDPVRTITVAVARSGLVTLTLVHETEAARGPSRAGLGQSTLDALAMLCTTSGGPCGLTGRLRPAPLPPTGEPTGFVGVVDLPPVPGVDTPWVGTDSVPATVNPAATLCDRTDFDRGGVRAGRSRTLVLPREDVPVQFGVSQSVGRVATPDAAKRFIDAVAARMSSCPDRELGVDVEAVAGVSAGDVSGRVWLVTYELPSGAVDYRVAVVRSGSAVTQLTLSPTDAYDMGAAAFERLAVRAGVRLAELGPAARAN